MDLTHRMAKTNSNIIPLVAQEPEVEFKKLNHTKTKSPSCKIDISSPKFHLVGPVNKITTAAKLKIILRGKHMEDMCPDKIPNL